MIVWLSSYPKSGNTWIRSFLSTYLNTSDGIFNLSLLDSIKEFPDHNILNKYMDNKNFHNLGEVSKNWIKVQEFINLKKKHIFLKTHNAFCNINGNLFTNSNNTSAFIYVVRDPRNVILSMSNHFGITQEESFKIITNEKHIIYPQIGNELIPATLVSSWGNNYSSWKNCNSIPKIIIKYEDLIHDAEKNFKKIINFLKQKIKIEYDEEKIINSARTTQFENLKKIEDEHGFNAGQKNKFFYLGKKNDWRNLLAKGINDRIIIKFESEMKELEYI